MVGHAVRDLHDDLRHALRRLRRHPGYAALVVATLALGIGATTVLASVIYGVLLRPLPWPHAERLVRLAETREGATREWPLTLSNGTYLAWADDPRTIEGIAAWQQDTVTLSGGEQAERIRISSTTASLFPLLEARALLGDAFSAEDEHAGEVVVLSHGLWRQAFGGDPGVLGKVVELDGRAHRVIGVMASSFVFPDRETRAWTPMLVPPVVGEDGESRSIAILNAIARLRPGVSPEQAAAEATARGRGAPDPGLAAGAMFGSNGPVRVSAKLVLEALTAEVRPALLLLLGAVGLLFLTATANVASLQLARAASRRRELAIRTSLGAGTAELSRLLLAESLVLGLTGGGVGLALAAALGRGLPSWLPADFPRLDAIALDLRVAAFAVVLSLGAGVAIGLLPALGVRRWQLRKTFGEDSAGAVGVGPGGPARARAAILVGQVAVAVVLLLGALQVGRSFFAMLAADRGFERSSVLTARLPMPDSIYDAARRRAILDELVERLRALPGVHEAAFTDVMPLGRGDAMMSFSAPPSAAGGDEISISTGIRSVSPGYFEALGRPLVAGRELTAADTRTSAPVVVVNRTFASRYLGGEPIGKALPARLDGERVDWQVVGVVEDVVQRGLGEPAQPEMFASVNQLGGGLDHPEPSILVRTAGPPQAMVATLRALVREQDETLVLEGVQTMEQLVRDSLAEPRLYSLLFGAFAFCALVIAGVGLFGALSYAVSTRTREIGVRVALGAGPRDVLRLALGQGIALAALGLGLGLAVALGAVQYATTLLYGVAPWDLWSLVAVTTVFGIVVATAAALPALRAGRIDPQRAIRQG